MRCVSFGPIGRWPPPEDPCDVGRDKKSRSNGRKCRIFVGASFLLVGNLEFGEGRIPQGTLIKCRRQHAGGKVRSRFNAGS
jgi:hypothetical protein